MNDRAGTGHVGGMSTSRVRALVPALPALVLAFAGTAAAEPVSALHLVVRGDVPAPGAIATAVAAELAQPVDLRGVDATCPLPCAVITADPAHAQVTVQVALPGGGLRQRTIGLPADPAAAIDVIALLTGNLARDEAAELLRDLAADVPAEAAPVATEPDEEPAREPVAGEPTATAASDGPVASPEQVAAAPLAPPPFVAARAADGTPVDGARTVGLAFGLVPFVGVDTGDRPGFALDLVVGVRRHQGLLGVAGVTSVVREDVSGLQLAGVAAVAGRAGLGQLGGVAAVSRGQVGALQLGGVAADAGGVDGVQLGGVSASTRRDVGVQAGGVAAVAGGVAGLQLGGVAAVAHDAGVQLGGVAAVAKGDVGLQLGGVASVAGTVHGLQLGVVNVARRNQGLQLGLVNVARTGDGASLGLINVVPGGRSELEVTVDAERLGALVLRHGGRRWHNVYGVATPLDGLGDRMTTDQTWMYGIGVGPSFTAGRTTLDVELMAWHVLYADELPLPGHGPDAVNVMSQLRAVVGLPVGPLHLVAGASADVFVTTDERRSTTAARYGMGTMSTTGAEDVRVTVWPTVFVGGRL